jgi:hypothetical protein
MSKEITSWHVSVAAEAVAAAQFARCGIDVSVQYGADQPEYDLIIAKDEHLVKVSVKGSQVWKWGLAQSYVEKADYHKAIEIWKSKFKPNTILCFVQFKGVELDQMPRLYLATPEEVAGVLNDISEGKGSAILYEEHDWTHKAGAFGTFERIPDGWHFTKERVFKLLGAG